MYSRTAFVIGKKKKERKEWMVNLKLDWSEVEEMSTGIMSDFLFFFPFSSFFLMAALAVY